MASYNRTPSQEVKPEVASQVSEVCPLAEDKRTTSKGEMDTFSRETSFIPFDNQSMTSNEQCSLANSNLLSERDRAQFEELEWLDKDGNEVIMQDAWNIHHMTRTQLGQHVNHGCPPIPVLKRMLKNNSAKPAWPEARRWGCEKCCYLARKDEALGQDSLEWVQKRLRNSSTTSSMTKKDGTDSVHTDSPIFLHSSDHPDFKEVMTAPVLLRSVLFLNGLSTFSRVHLILSRHMIILSQGTLSLYLFSHEISISLMLSQPSLNFRAVHGYVPFLLFHSDASCITHVMLPFYAQPT